MTERLYVRRDHAVCPGGYRYSKKTPGHTRRRYDALLFMNKLQNPFPAPPGAAPPAPGATIRSGATSITCIEIDVRPVH